MTEEEFQIAIERLVSGDKMALQQIYQAYIKLIYSVIFDKVKHRETAEDITSEFFIKLIRVADSYKKGSAHKAWLVTIARNMTIDYLRKNKEMLASELVDNQNDSPNDNILDDIANKNQSNSLVENQVVLAEDLKSAMQQLTDSEREIIDMKLIGNLKFNEIAKILGKPIGTVTWTYNQGIKKVRRYLKDYEG